MTQIYLAFSHTNGNLADILEKNIPEIAFSRISDADDATPGRFAETVAAAPYPVVLLLTDNFIKSEAAMSGMLAALLSLMRQNRVMVVIANGTREENGEIKAVETHIDRVVYAIQYMNYWQQQYLAMSDQYNHSEDTHRTELFQHQQRLHDIADQAGEFISALRDADPVKWDYLSVTGFQEVYRFAGITPHRSANSASTPVSPAAPAPEPPAPTSAIPTTTTVPVTGPLTFRPVEPLKPFQEPLAPPTPEFDPAAHLVHPNDADTTLPENGNYAEQDINNTIKDAWSWIERGNRDLGIEVLRSALEQYPQHEQLRLEYEKALHEDEIPEEVLAPQDDAAAYEAAGESAFADSDFLMAKYCWDRAAESNPDLPGIWKKLGFLTSDQLTGYNETSIAYLKKAMAQNPDDETIVERLRKMGENIPLPEATQPEPTDNSPQESSSVETSPPVEVSVAVPQPVAAPVSAPSARRHEIVMVTGATSGIGRATAVEFARHGYRLIVTGRRAERLYDLRTELENQFGVEVLPLVFDVRDQRAVEGNLTNLPESWQNIDILINNAGLAKGLAPIHEGELHHWETMIDTNIKGLLYVTQLVSRGMVVRRRGHIVNLSSSAGKEAYPNGNVYCATKFAVEALTKSMRFDLHKYGIRVSQVSPGHVEETEFALTRFDGDGEKAKIYNDFQPLTARDVAEAIWFIASRPAHVNVQDVYMFGTQQASATVVDRSGRS